MFWSKRKAGTAVRCPECQTPRPALTLLELTTTRLAESGELIEVVDGYRKACQHCPCIYNVDALGVYAPHKHALPLARRMDQVERETPPARNVSRETLRRDDLEEPEPPILRPKARPAV